jgi:hypothetical protein
MEFASLNIPSERYHVVSGCIDRRILYQRLQVSIARAAKAFGQYRRPARAIYHNLDSMPITHHKQRYPVSLPRSLGMKSVHDLVSGSTTVVRQTPLPEAARLLADIEARTVS